MADKEDESSIPGFLENIEAAVSAEGGPQESSPPRRSAQEEVWYDEVGKPASPDSELTEEGKAELEAQQVAVPTQTQAVTTTLGVTPAASPTGGEPEAAPTTTKA